LILQAAAARLAMCDDIGEAAYTTSLVASAMLLRFQFMQGAGASAARRTIQERYDMDISKTTPEAFLETVADTMFKGDKEVAGHRLLQDYRKGRLGSVALEVPPAEDSVKPDNGGYAPR
jgi:ribosome biogenesis GTPase A